MIGPRELVVFYLTSLVGAGILLIPGLAARAAGPASLLAWVALALASYPMARLFAEMSARHPDCAGIGALIRSGLGARAGDTTNLLLVVVYVIFNPVLGIASARYLCHFVGLNSGLVRPVAALFMLAAVAFNLLGISTGAKLQGAVLVVLLSCLAAAVALAVPAMSGQRFHPFAPRGWTAVGSAAAVAFFSFLGWDNVSAVAEEVVDPRRSFHRAIAVAVPLVALLYLSVTAAFLAVPSQGNVLVMPSLLRGSFGGASVAAGDLLALAVIVLATNAWVLGASRLVVAAARQGLVPATFERVSPRTGSPIPALCGLGVAYTVVLGACAVLEVEESEVITLTTAIFLLLYLAAAVAALRDRPTRTMTISALLTCVTAGCFLPFTTWALPLAAIIILALHAAAAARKRARRSLAPDPVAVA